MFIFAWLWMGFGMEMEMEKKKKGVGGVYIEEVVTGASQCEVGNGLKGSVSANL